MIHDIVVVEDRDAVMLMRIDAAEEIEQTREAADLARLAIDAFVREIRGVDVLLQDVPFALGACLWFTVGDCQHALLVVELEIDRAARDFRDGAVIRDARAELCLQDGQLDAFFLRIKREVRVDPVVCVVVQAGARRLGIRSGWNVTRVVTV